MKKAYIFCHYADYLLGVGESMRLVLTEAFNDLGYTVEYFYKITNIASDYDDIVLFVMDAPTYIAHLNFKFGNGKKILYNLEILSLKNEQKPLKKSELRRKAIERVLLDKSVDSVWIFNKHYCLDINDNNVHFVPVGVSKSIIKYNQDKNDRLLFFGNVGTTMRKKMVAELSRNAKLDVIVHRDFKNIDNMLDTIGKYAIGIDYGDSPCADYIRWHRVMLYAASKIVLLTNTKLLSDFGFIDGKHYLSFDNPNDIVKIYNRVSTNKNLLEEISNNMLNKFINEYSMKDIIRKVI